MRNHLPINHFPPTLSSLNRSPIYERRNYFSQPAAKLVTGSSSLHGQPQNRLSGGCMEFAPGSFPFPLKVRSVLAQGCQMQEDLAVELARREGLEGHAGGLALRGAVGEVEPAISCSFPGQCQGRSSESSGLKRAPLRGIEKCFGFWSSFFYPLCRAREN